MSTVGQIVAAVLTVYWVLLIARLVIDLVRVFARQWEPRGILLVVAETVFTLTDPPLRLLRRFIPPLRIGGIAFDLAFLILLVGIQILINIALSIG